MGILQSNCTKLCSASGQYQVGVVTKLNEAIGLDAKQAMDLAVIQYSMLIGMQQVCSALSAKQFKELQDMVINKFKEQ